MAPARGPGNIRKALEVQKRMREQFPWKVGDWAQVQLDMPFLTIFRGQVPDRFIPKFDPKAGFEGPITALNPSEDEVQFENRWWIDIKWLVRDDEIDWEDDDDPVLDDDDDEIIWDDDDEILED